MPFPLKLWFVHPDADACEALRERFAWCADATVHHSRFEDLPPHDCFVTAANSYGHMTAGIDAAVVGFHGEELMTRVQHRILDEYLGEQPVGTAFLIETHTPNYPWVCHTPTMRVPGSIDRTDKVYTATWAALLAIYRHNAAAGPDGDRIKTVAFPLMGAGFGGVAATESARQMAVACRYYFEPSHRLNWDAVVERHKAIVYDDGKPMM
ncbi:macro domain-containing protein [Alienimonas chondri]|uniref:Macro domain-containing protein n=1 Tax=Alienimonas chondri TaxID=2681879 RepID=A0ABX1VEG8_9PLAN|nr:macro domain-containing protein [Alienimonas chondri]NNJ25682.1 hypothetical protein [Alienimonas chondri]